MSSKPADDVFENGEAASFYKKALQYSFDGIWILNPSGTVLFANDANERFHGHNGAYYTGKNIHDMISDGVLIKSAALRVFATKKQCTVQLRKDGRHIFITSMPVFKEDGSLEMVISNTRDVTEILSHGYEENILDQGGSCASIPLSMGHGEEAKEIVLAAEASRALHALLKKVAGYTSTVHISGESGTGKEMAARMLHALSPNAGEPFWGVNCGAIPPALLESEMFGYEAGAFTGASSSKPGIFELAGHGSILLDEIGCLPLEMQAKLLRAIQEKQFMRVGGVKMRPISARIMSATNKPLLELVRQGLFREDLYYRLNVVKVEVPPLRQRREDIPHIIFNKLGLMNARYKSSKIITPEALHMLINYSWPGNIRELENVVEGMFVISDTLLEVSSLPAEVLAHYRPGLPRQQCTLKSLMDAYEAEAIRAALREHKSIKEAARALGLDYTTLWRKIKKQQNQPPNEGQTQAAEAETKP